MKPKIYKLFLLFLFSLMPFFPNEIFIGSREGLLLWFQIVLPTLLPFLILSNLLIYTNAVRLINRVLSPFFCRLFHITKEACFAVLVGFLCGYPMGAKVTADLIQTNRISTREGSYILSFCNNTSPFFIISFVISQNLQMYTSVIPLLLILMITPILASYIFRPFYNDHGNYEHLYRKQNTKKIQASNMNFQFHILDTCIMNSFETITKIGGYIIIFSIAITCLGSLPFANNNWFISLLATLEITNGIVLLCNEFGSSVIGIILVLMLTSFGGFCSILQTNSMIHPVRLSIRAYVLQKVITAILTGILGYCYLCLQTH
ncbi:MAG: transporter [Lachnospiraceae bacterium]